MAQIKLKVEKARRRILLAGNSNNKGFSLIEVLVVLSIIGLLSSLIIPVFGKGNPQVEINSAASRLASILKLCRSEAIAKNEKRTFVIDVGVNNFYCDSLAKKYSYKQEIETELTTTEKGVAENSLVGKMFFYPDGSSSGANINLKHGDIKRAITVDWITGKVELLSSKVK